MACALDERHAFDEANAVQCLLLGQAYDGSWMLSHF